MNIMTPVAICILKIWECMPRCAGQIMFSKILLEGGGGGYHGLGVREGGTLWGREGEVTYILHLATLHKGLHYTVCSVLGRYMEIRIFLELIRLKSLKVGPPAKNEQKLMSVKHIFAFTYSYVLHIYLYYLWYYSYLPINNILYIY